MECARFKHLFGHYSRKEVTSASMDMLATFLTSDVGFPGEYGCGFRNWIYDDQYEETGGNYCFLEKEGNNIIIGCSYWKDDPYEWTFECTREQLAHILDRWAELVPLRPKEIIIIYDGETYCVEGRNFPEQNKQ